MSKKLLTLFGGGPSWLFKESFGVDDAAPVSSPHQCVPGPGLFEITDTGGDVSIGGGVLTIAGGTTSWSDPRLIGTKPNGDGFAREYGLAMLASIKRDAVGSSNVLMVGWRSAKTGGTESIEHAAYVYSDDDRYWTGGTTFLAAFPSNVNSADTWYRYALVLRDSGCHFFKHSTGKTWTRLYVDHSGTTATLYPSIQQTTALATGNYDDVIVDRIPGWNSDSDVALISSATAGNFTHEADCLIEWVPGGVDREVTFRKVDASNYLQLAIDGSGNFALKKITDGSPSDLATWAGSMDGTERVVAVIYSNDIYVYVDNVQRANKTNESQGQTATAGNLSDNATEFFVWRRTETLPFDFPGNSPETVFFAESGDSVEADSDYYMTAWGQDTGGAITIGGSGTLTNVAAYGGVPFIGQSPTISTYINSCQQPYDIYALLCRSNRPGGTAMTNERGLHWVSSSISSEVHPVTGVPKLHGIEFSDVAVAENQWQRVRLHVNGQTSFIQVEDDKSALAATNANALAGTTYLLSKGAQIKGLHTWVGYFKITHGDIDATQHAAIWSAMETRADELAFWESTIVTQDTKHNAFPGYVILSGGKELTVYRKATSHSEPDGVIVLKSRADLTSSWSAETTILDQTADGVDLRDVSLMQTSTGRVICSGDAVKVSTSESWCWVLYSDDDGATWTGPVLIGHPWSRAVMFAPAVEVGGNLYQPIYEHYGDPYDIGLGVSEDDGETWDAADFVLVAEGSAEVDLYEPSLIIVDGEWCVLARCSDHNTRLFTSPDGATWTARGTVFQSASEHTLVALGDGRVLAVYRGSDSGFSSLRYRTSSDALRTWSSESSIKPHPTTTEYSALVRRSDGMVVGVASFQVRVSSDPVINGADIHYFERDEDDL